jgi:hypothetical protein
MNFTLFSIFCTKSLPLIIVAVSAQYLLSSGHFIASLLEKIHGDSLLKNNPFYHLSFVTLSVEATIT